MCIHLASFMFMEIPEHIRKKADFLRKQQRALSKLHDTITSESLIANVLDLNDDLIHSSGIVSSIRGQTGTNATGNAALTNGAAKLEMLPTTNNTHANMQNENGGVSRHFGKVASQFGKVSSQLSKETNPPPPNGFRDNDSEIVNENEPLYEASAVESPRKPLFRIGTAENGVGNLGRSRVVPEFGSGTKAARDQQSPKVERTCQHYRAQITYVLHELKCLSNKVYGDGTKDAIKRYLLKIYSSIL